MRETIDFSRSIQLLLLGKLSNIFNPGPFNLNKDLWLRIGNGNELDTALTKISSTDNYQIRWYLEGLANLKYRYEGILPYFFTEPKKSEELLTIKPNVTSYTLQAYQEFALGTRDPNSDADWNNYLAQLKKLGVDKYVAYTQEAYMRWHSILDKK